MIKAGKSSAITLAEKCTSILASGWHGTLNTIKADAKGSKGDIYSSKVKYFVCKGKPYIWLPEEDLHNVNAIIDERGSFAVSSPFPGPLLHLLRSIKKLPARVALVGDITHLKDEKAKAATEKLRETISTAERALSELSYPVSQILTCSSSSPRGSANHLNAVLDGTGKYSVYKFNPSLCMYIDGKGIIQEINMEDFLKAKADPLSEYAAGLIDGINRSEERRRALVLFCITFLKLNAKDALIVRMDRKGFDVLGKVMDTSTGEYRWKELRFSFNAAEEARDVESFVMKLIQMERHAVTTISRISGIR
ncbi:hypothetical protein M569_14350 [Genlisea aurea]|uniref:DUF2470 domain-containing protein n=1 Tax=Genlisea aurea TaxID=192259 RepID=S8C197_9LAMI|nr:hypothetical protein M569_14350 [Genlisea aurea]